MFCFCVFATKLIVFLPKQWWLFQYLYFEVLSSVKPCDIVILKERWGRFTEYKAKRRHGVFHFKDGYLFTLISTGLSSSSIIFADDDDGALSTIATATVTVTVTITLFQGVVTSTFFQVRWWAAFPDSQHEDDFFKNYQNPEIKLVCLLTKMRSLSAAKTCIQIQQYFLYGYIYIYIKEIYQGGN